MKTYTIPAGTDMWRSQSDSGFWEPFKSTKTVTYSAIELLKDDLNRDLTNFLIFPLPHAAHPYRRIGIDRELVQVKQ